MFSYCCLYHKDTKLKANHNLTAALLKRLMTVAYITKILNWKQITTELTYWRWPRNCCLYHKDTKLKANHNCLTIWLSLIVTVAYITKILNWKQITTREGFSFRTWNCCLYHKDTKLKANHNIPTHHR